MSMRTRICCVILTVAYPAVGFTADTTAQERTAAATRIAIADRPLIDGRLDEQCWANAAWQGDLTLLGTNRPPSQPTRFRILHDDDNLYIGVECTEPNMDQLKQIKSGGIFRGDSIELFLDLNRDRQTYYHLITNTLGVCEGSRDDRELVWRASVHKAKDRWTSEIAIPLSSFCIGPEVQEVWNFNLCRQRYAGKRELSTWAPLGPDGGFHQPQRFGELRGLEVDFKRFACAVDLPEPATRIKGQTLEVEFKVPVANRTGKPASLRLEGSLIPPVGKPQASHADLALGVGKQKTVTLSGYAVDKSGDYTLLVALTDPTRCEVYYRTRSAVPLAYTPLGIRLVEPCYRASIYATQKMEQIRLFVDVGLDEPSLRTSSLTVHLLRNGSPEALQTRQVAPLASDQVEVTFNARNLEIGDYLIRASLLDKSGKTVAATEHDLHKLTPAPGSEVRLDDNFNTIINGEPAFIYGYFSVTNCYPGRDWKGMHETHADGCNALLHYGAHYWNEESGKRFLDAASANGLGVVIYPYYRTFFSEGGLPHIGDPDTQLTDKMKQGITEAVNRWKNHPALLAWFLSDEPDCNNWSPHALEEVYRLVKGLDSYHPCIVLCRYAGTHRAVRNCADIFMPDPYIHPRIDGRFDTPLVVFRDYFAATKETGKAAWVTPQAFAPARNGSMWCEPSFDHLRAMAYMAVVHDVKGVLYYAWSYLTRYPASYLGARFLSREMAAISPMLLSPTSPTKVRVDPENAGVDVLLKEHRGELYLIAVNTQCDDVDATFHIPGLSADTVSVIPEGREVRVHGERFTDRFSKYEVHLYTTACAVPDAVSTIQQVKAEVAAKHAERFKEGNLCLRLTRDGRLTGVTCEGPQGIWSIDGITDRFTSWKWSAHPDPPVDLTVTFARAETVGRVVVYTPNVRDYEVQAWDAANWVTLASVAGNTEPVVTSRFAAVKTDKLRLHVTSVNTPDWENAKYGFAGSGVVIDEVEAYTK